MNKLNSTSTQFLEAFAQRCYELGFTEKQANELFTAYAQTEAYEKDPSFRAGVEEELAKSAGVMQALKTLGGAAGRGLWKGKSVAAPLGLGLGAGAAVESGILPGDVNSGTAIGAGLGAGLGAASMIKNPALIGKAMSRVFGAPMYKAPGAALGILGTKQFLQKGLKPIAKGAIGGGLFGLGAATAGQIKNEGLGMGGQYPNLDPNTGVPWYMNNSAGGNASTASGAPDPYDLPSDIAAHLQNPNQAGSVATGGLSGPLADIAKHKENLMSIESQIAQAQAQLPATANDPNAYMQRQNIQAHMDRLKMQRNSIVQSMSQAEQLVASDKRDMNAYAMQRQQQATGGLNASQREFENIQNRLNRAQQGGIGGMAYDWYNRATGAADRMRQLQPQYDSYKRTIEQARKIQGMAQ